jgi:hypothetical protein
MRFQFYSEAIAGEPKLSVDGTVDNAIHFSHWQGNETPAEVKADTSTEIALNLVTAPNRDELTGGVELVTNNHFDTDGVLSVWTVVNGDRALPLRDRLIAAAEAGDFCELSSRDAVRASIVIQGSDSPTDKAASPLALKLAGEDFVSEVRSYELVLPHVEDVIANTDKYEELWRDHWQRIDTALDSFAEGSSTVEEFADVDLSLVTLAPEIFGPNGFDPARDAVPFTAISSHAQGTLFVITTALNGGWAYRIDYPYYSWAETLVRPAVARRDLTLLLERLNQLEPSTRGSWQADSSELASAAKFARDGRLQPSQIEPDEVMGHIRQIFSGAGF